MTVAEIASAIASPHRSEMPPGDIAAAVHGVHEFSDAIDALAAAFMVAVRPIAEAMAALSEPD